DMMTTMRIAMISAEPRFPDSAAGRRAESPWSMVPPEGFISHSGFPPRDHRPRQMEARRRPGSLDQPLVEVDLRRARIPLGHALIRDDAAEVDPVPLRIELAGNEEDAVEVDVGGIVAGRATVHRRVLARAGHTLLAHRGLRPGHAARGGRVGHVEEVVPRV